MALGAGGVLDAWWHCGAPSETFPEWPIGSLEDSVAASQENAPASKLNGMTRDIPLFRE